MRFIEYLKHIYESTAISNGNVSIEFQASNKEELKKLNPKTNRLKVKKKAKHHKTDISPSSILFKR